MILLKWIKLPILIGLFTAIIAQDAETEENEIVSEISSVLPYSDHPTTILFSKYREENNTILNNDFEIEKNAPETVQEENLNEVSDVNALEYVVESDDESAIQEEREKQLYDVSYNFNYDVPVGGSKTVEDTNSTNSEPITDSIEAESNQETTLNETETPTTEVVEAVETVEVKREEESNNNLAIEVENTETGKDENSLPTDSVDENEVTEEENKGNVSSSETLETEVYNNTPTTESLEENRNTDEVIEDKTLATESVEEATTTAAEEVDNNTKVTESVDETTNVTAAEIPTTETVEETTKADDEEVNNSSPVVEHVEETVERSNVDETSENSDGKDLNESMPNTTSEYHVDQFTAANVETENPTEPIIILGRSKFTNSPDDTPSTTSEPMTDATESDLVIQREIITSESPANQYSRQFTDQVVSPIDPNSYLRPNLDNTYNQQYSTNDYYEENEYSMLPENCDPNDPTHPCGMETPKPVRYPVAENQYPTESPYDEYGYNRYREYDAYHQSNDRRYNVVSYDEFSSNIDVDNEKIQIEYKWPVSHQSPNFRQCHMALDPGNGPDEINTWYYDRQDGKCKWFAYGGYGGNANRFYSRGACIHLCIMNNDNPCLQSNIECWGSTQCESYRDKECIEYQESRNRNVDEICPPAQPVCMTKRKSRIQPKVDKTNIPSECSQKMDAGTCTDAKPVVRYYYDTYLQTCKSFYFFKSKTSNSNCGGNSNRFVTKDDCMNYCSP